MKASRFNEKIFVLAPAALLFLAVSLFFLRTNPQWFLFAGFFFFFVLFYRKRIYSAENSLWAFFVFILSLSAFFSVDPAGSAQVLWRYAVYLAFFFICASAGKKAGEYWLAVLVAAGFMLSVSAVVGGEGFIRRISPNPNYAACFVSVSGILSLFFSFSKKGLKKAVLFSLALISLWALTVINSRGAFLSFFAGSALAAWKMKGRKAAAAVFFLPVLVFLFVPGEYAERIMKTGSPESYQRINIWLAALKAFMQKPLFGWGAGMFEKAFSANKFPFYDGISFFGHKAMHAHSEILNLLAEGGLLAPLFFAAAFLKTFRKAWHEKEKAVFCIASAGCLVQGLFDVSMFSGAVSLLFWGSMGFAEGSSFPKRSFMKDPSAVAVFLPLLFLFMSFKAEEYPVPLNPYSEKSVNSALLDSLGKSGSYPRLAAAADYGRFYHPFSPRFLFASAESSLKAGDLLSAEKFLDEAVSLEPNFCRAYAMSAEISPKAENKEREKILKRIDEIKGISRRPETEYERFILYCPPEVPGGG